MKTFAEYANAFEFIKFRREDGILEMALHTKGGPFAFSEDMHHDFSEVCNAVNRDPENRVVILTGTGDRFCAAFDFASFYKHLAVDAQQTWIRVRRDGTRMLTAFLDIEIPFIAAINGPAVSHSELPLLADVVLCADTTIFQDATHFIAGIPPGDGMHVVWTTLLGLNRGRYFLMTGQKLTAQEALAAGVVGEVLPLKDLNARAWELARQWVKHPLLNLHGTRAILTTEWKRKMTDYLHAGLTYEAMSALMNQPPPMDPSAPMPPIIDLLAGQ